MMESRVHRRRFACSVTGAALLAMLGVPGHAAQPRRPKMPAPTGKCRVGKVDLHLVEHGRRDPFGTSDRELMISIYYPAAGTAGYPAAPYLSRRMAAVADLYYTRYELALEAGAVDWQAIAAHARVGAPAAAGRFPVIVYQPPHLRPRSYATADAEDLASHGNVVVTSESTHEAMGVEFPDGSVAETRISPDPGPGQFPADGRLLTVVRVADLHFVLHQLRKLACGGNPDAEQRRLPIGVGAALDMSRLGMYGTLGGSVAGLQAAHEGAEFGAIAGLYDVIGTEEQDYAPVVHRGVATPYLLLSVAGEPDSQLGSPGWSAFWPKLRGWKRNVPIGQTNAHVFGDYIWTAPQIRAVTEKTRHALYGTIDPVIALATQRAYLHRFFSLTLR